MRSIQLLLTFFAITFISEAVAQDIEQDAVRNGFQLLPTAAGSSSDSASKKSRLVYVKITEPGRRISVLTTAEGQADDATRYKVLTFEIDCIKSAMKYLSVQAIEDPGSLASSGVPLLKTVWHTPTKGSVPAQALDFSCRP